MKKNQIAKLALMGLAAFIATGAVEASAAVSETQGVFLAGGCGKNCGSQSARSRRYNVAMEDQTNVPSNANQNTWNYGQQPQNQGNKAPSQVNPQPSPDNQGWNNSSWTYRNPTADATNPTIPSNQGSYNYSNSQSNNPSSNANNQNLNYGTTPNKTYPNSTNTGPNTSNSTKPNAEQGYWIEEDVIDIQPNNSNGPKSNWNSSSTPNNSTQKPSSYNYNYGK